MKHMHYHISLSVVIFKMCNLRETERRRDWHKTRAKYDNDEIVHPTDNTLT